MTLPIILDIIAVLIIGFCIISGWRKGLIGALLGIGVTIVSVVAAWALAAAFTPLVSGVIERNIGPSIQQLADFAKVGEDMLPDLSGVSAPQAGDAAKDALEKLGFTGGYNAISGAVSRKVNEAGMSVKEATESTIYGAMAFAAVFIFGFIFVRAILEFAIKFIADRLPVINNFNYIGGAALGLLQGLLIMFILGWALQFAGRWISAESISETYVMKYFINFGIFNWLGGLLARVL